MGVRIPVWLVECRLSLRARRVEMAACQFKDTEGFTGRARKAEQVRASESFTKDKVSISRPAGRTDGIFVLSD